MSDDITAALNELRAHLDALAAVQRATLQQLHLAGALRMQDVAERMSSSPALFQSTVDVPENEKLTLMKERIHALGEALDQFDQAQPVEDSAEEQKQTVQSPPEQKR